jgi:hypothetical protein
MRTIITTYYGPGKARPIVKINRSSRRDEALPNVCRHMTNNDYGAVVAEVVDEGTAELLLVVTYHMGENMRVAFKSDVRHPVCITNI